MTSAPPLYIIKFWKVCILFNSLHKKTIVLTFENFYLQAVTPVTALALALNEILKSQQIIQSTTSNDNSADFWEFHLYAVNPTSPLLIMKFWKVRIFNTWNDNSTDFGIFWSVSGGTHIALVHNEICKSQLASQCTAIQRTGKLSSPRYFVASSCHTRRHNEILKTHFLTQCTTWNNFSADFLRIFAKMSTLPLGTIFSRPGKSRDSRDSVPYSIYYMKWL